MALGYEGYVKIGGIYALGTGTSVPRERVRIDSQSGYGGVITSPVSTIGIGSPHTYDWERHDGSLNFEVTNDIFAFLKAWVYDRDGQRDIEFSSRDGNVQRYVDTFWNSISVSATQGSLVDGSVGFVSIERQTYDYGQKGLTGYIQNKSGQGLLCPLAAGMPAPLNAVKNYNPIPYWNTKFLIDGIVYDMLDWTLDCSQEVVKFFACNYNASPQAPSYVGVGPMSITLGGSWMWLDLSKPVSFPSDNVAVSIQVGGTVMDFLMGQLQTTEDDVQSGDATTPVKIEYSAYRLS